MTNFSWQTEEDARWDASLEPEPEETPRPSRWPLLVGLILVGLLAGGLLYRQLNQRVEVATEEVSDDLMASHILLQNLRHPDDREVLINFLSGSEPDWSEAQERLLLDGILFDRPGLGLHALPETFSEDQVEAVELSPDLRSAVITATRPYAINVGNGVTETVTLRQTAVYRLGPGRWLYAPPQPEFWGETVRYGGQYLSAQWPERNGRLTYRLVRDLDNKLAQACSQPGLTCPPDLHTLITFSTDPASLDLPTGPPALRPFEREVTLPAPTLVGLPTDETGYNALFRGYATPLVAAAVNAATGWECCKHPVTYQAMMGELLRLLGLQSRPFLPGDYSTLVADPITFFELGRMWDISLGEADRRERILLHAFAAFLVDEASVEPLGLLVDDIAVVPDGDFWPWLMNRTEYLSRAPLEADWQAYLRVGVTAAPLPATLPDQTLQLTCRPPGGFQSYVYRYEDGRWEQGPALGEGSFYLHPLPDSSDFIVYQHTPTETRLSLWRDGEPISISLDNPPPLPVVPLSHPTDGRFVLFRSFLNDNAFYRLDPAACQPGDCALEPLAGRPIWSPDGRRTLVQTMDGRFLDHRPSAPVYLGDADGNPIGEPAFNASSVAWLDDERFVYATTGEDGSHVLTGAADDETVKLDGEALLTSHDLQEFVGTQSLDFLSIYHLATAADGRLLLLTSDLLSSRIDHNLFVVEPSTGSGQGERIEERLNLNLMPMATNLSPDGHYFGILTATDAEGDLNGFFLHDVAGGRTWSYTIDRAFPTYEGWQMLWSADGRWLAQMASGGVQLISPDNGQETILIPPNDLTCTAVIWEG